MLYKQEQSETLHVFTFTKEEVDALYYAIYAEPSDLSPKDRILVDAIEAKLFTI